MRRGITTAMAAVIITAQFLGTGCASVAQKKLCNACRDYERTGKVPVENKSGERVAVSIGMGTLGMLFGGIIGGVSGGGSGAGGGAILGLAGGIAMGWGLPGEDDDVVDKETFVTACDNYKNGTKWERRELSKLKVEDLNYYKVVEYDDDEPEVYAGDDATMPAMKKDAARAGLDDEGLEPVETAKERKARLAREAKAAEEEKKRLAREAKEAEAERIKLTAAEKAEQERLAKLEEERVQKKVNNALALLDVEYFEYAHPVDYTNNFTGMSIGLTSGFSASLAACFANGADGESLVTAVALSTVAGGVIGWFLPGETRVK